MPWRYIHIYVNIKQSHLTVKYHTQVMNSTMSIPLMLMWGISIWLLCCLVPVNIKIYFIIIQFQHSMYHSMFDFNHTSLEFVDCYISTILVSRLECQVQLVIICLDMKLNSKFSWVISKEYHINVEKIWIYSWPLWHIMLRGTDPEVLGLTGGLRSNSEVHTPNQYIKENPTLLWKTYYIIVN